MATIANLTVKNDGSFEGNLATLTVSAPIAIVPNGRKSHENEPDEQRARPQALDDLALVGHLSNAARALGRSAEPRPEW